MRARISFLKSQQTMKRTLLAISLTLFVFMIPGIARPQQALGPAAFCGVPTFAAPNPQGASATIWQGTPVIIIDHSQFADRAWLMFVVAHECGHHVIGHTLPVGFWFRQTQFWATASQELQADCWAARSVPPNIATYAARYFALIQGPVSGGPGYPSGHQRAANILQCAGLN